MVPTITSLLVALSPSPGEDQGVVDFKSKLKRSMLDRLGDKELIERYSVATLLDPRYSKLSRTNLILIICRFKNCFFNKKQAKDQAEAALLRLLKAEVEAEPTSHHNSGGEQDCTPEQPALGLAGVFQQLRQRGGPGQGSSSETEETCIKKYLDSELETVACLKYWESQATEAANNKFKAAFCRLARFV